MKKKVLIVAYAFPPMAFIGSQRPHGLAKYLNQFGWEPIILTIKSPGAAAEDFKVIGTDYTDRLALMKKTLRLDTGKGIHQQLGITITRNFNYPTWKSKTIKFLKELAVFPDEEIGWYRHAVKAAFELLDKEEIHAVISTSFPVTSHLIARRIKQKYGVPWVADLRDLWTQNHYYGKFKVISFFERRLELKTLSQADVLVTISNPLAETLKSLHLDKDIRCITNGYDPEDFDKKTANLTEKFTITYTGRLYNGKRDPSVLLKAIAGLIKENRIRKDLIEIRFFGGHEDWLINDIKEHGLQDIVKINGFVSREEAIEKQKESQLLLLLLWDDKEEKGVYTGKLFEYLGAKRPIVAIGGANSIVRDLLENTNAGHFAENQEQSEAVIMHYYYEFIKQGAVEYRANEKISEYAYNEIAEKYSRLLNEVASFPTV